MLTESKSHGAMRRTVRSRKRKAVGICKRRRHPQVYVWFDPDGVEAPAAISHLSV